jgi:pSer/pThr/pTyr-binding forkhead associated (FHA) protein
MEVNLVMFKPNGARKNFPLVGEKVVIGRAASCDLQIPLLAVSRRHCEIWIAEGQVKVRDLASSNGTFVNNERVNDASLAAGDRLVIGPVVFTIQIDGQPDGIQQVKTRGQKLSEASHAGGEFDLDAEIAAGLGDTGLDDSSLDEVLFGEDDEGGDDATKGLLDEDDPMAALEAMGDEGEENDKADKG